LKYNLFNKDVFSSATKSTDKRKQASIDDDGFDQSDTPDNAWYAWHDGVTDGLHP